ncbi:hypothetical protein ABTZ58_39430 [Streptomyces sp. NPDC094143]|uniref:hypothetical protein n=1 Tax=Streptomyces sp. NPDC094143 TaxID=3155310 RepID=UPI00331CC15D
MLFGYIDVAGEVADNVQGVQPRAHVWVVRELTVQDAERGESLFDLFEEKPTREGGEVQVSSAVPELDELARVADEVSRYPAGECVNECHERVGEPGHALL